MGSASGAPAAGSRSSVLSRSDSEPERPERRTSRYEAPKRDEEAEANRKIKAKRARETRRSTQVRLSHSHSWILITLCGVGGVCQCDSILATNVASDVYYGKHLSMRVLHSALILQCNGYLSTVFCD